MVKKKKVKIAPPAPIGRRFFLRRQEDVSGVSGTGRVAFGIQMPSGKVVIEWLTATSSEGIYNSVDECIHIHGHDGATQLEWIDSLDTVAK